MIPWLPSSLLNHLWQSTLFVVVVWLATVALRSNRARVRYWLWMAASVKFLIPVSALVSLGEQFEWRTAPASVRPAVSFVIEDVLTPAVVVAAAPASIAPPLLVLPWLLLAVWVAGAAVVLTSWWRQWLPIRSAVRRATPVRLDAGCDADDLVVVSTPSIFEPGVVGILRPVLLLPDGLADRLTSLQLRALVAHERCHARCHDNLLAAVHMVVEAAFWFHPLVWWIDGRMIDERERACDEAVIRSGSHPRDYAEGILEVCRRSVASPLACVAGVSGSKLRRRVESIISGHVGVPLTVGRRLALACAAAVTIGGPVASGAVKSPADVQADVIGPRPKFEVASVKRNQSLKGPYGGLEFHPGGLRDHRCRVPNHTSTTG
jgi:beta-lactamase regulating signal transducer with metallopeptidase domain